MDVTFTRFVAALRNAEVDVSPAETLDAFAILERVGIGDQALLKDALALSLAKSQAEKARFEATFERFFGQLAFRAPPKRVFLRGIDREAMLRALAGSFSATVVEAVANVLDDHRDRLALRVQEAAQSAGAHQMRSLREKRGYAEAIGRALALDELDAHVAGGGGAGGDAANNAAEGALRYLRQYFHQEIRAYLDTQYRLHVDASGKRALLEAALASNLDQLPKAYHEEVRRVVAKLAARLANAHRRRRKDARRGLLDVKRTLRRNMAYDGAAFDLRWRQRKRQPATVFVLCDVSGSVARVARFLLLFLFELADLLPQLRAFAFSNRLGEVTATMRENASGMAVEKALLAWGNGNTDYARAFVDFRELAGGDLDQRSTLIVLGDARNNHYDPQPRLFEALSRRAKQTYWLNPESPEQWRSGDSEMRRYAPYCFKVETCNKIGDIERFADRLLLATR